MSFACAHGYQNLVSGHTDTKGDCPFYLTYYKPINSNAPYSLHRFDFRHSHDTSTILTNSKFLEDDNEGEASSQSFLVRAFKNLFTDPNQETSSIDDEIYTPKEVCSEMLDHLKMYKEVR